mmetsp:Transcript_13599/g.33357  ORF Transcript_13599/g.33357 Transcript_13599/m.33357 type:complete len:91 (-) Transcript_13599:111-383(-)
MTPSGGYWYFGGMNKAKQHPVKMSARGAMASYCNMWMSTLCSLWCTCSVPSASDPLRKRYLRVELLEVPPDEADSSMSARCISVGIGVEL